MRITSAVIVFVYRYYSSLTSGVMLLQRRSDKDSWPFRNDDAGKGAM
jgi:hypothetical protein